MAVMKVVALLLVLSVVSVASLTEAAITCAEAEGDIAPCLPYLTKSSPNCSSDCCSGVRTLNAAAAAETTIDRRTTCECLKEAAIHMHNLDPDRAAALPELCNVKLPFPISANINCSSIQ